MNEWSQAASLALADKWAQKLHRLPLQTLIRSIGLYTAPANTLSQDMYTHIVPIRHFISTALN